MPADILVLDDEASYANMLADFLKSEGFNAIMSTSPVEVIEMLRKRTFDLIVVDYKMPVMDGAEFLQKAYQLRPGLPVIMVSGMMHTPDLLKVANIGVPLVLEKPFDTEIFLEYVHRFASPKPEVTADALAASSGKAATPGAIKRAKKTARTRPPEIKYLSDASASMKYFISNLWANFDKARCHFIAMPPGSEFEQLLHELARWKQAERSVIRNIKVADLGDPETLELIKLFANDSKFAPVVGIGAGDASFTEQLLRIMRFVPLVESDEALHKISFVFQLTGWRHPNEPPADKDLPDFYSGKLHWLPPLRERPLDIAAYTRRQLHQLDPGGKATLSAEAMRLLFTYPWQGNYHELVSALWSTWQLRTAPRIEASTLYKALFDRDDYANSQEAKGGMEAILRVRQSEYLTRLYNLYGENLPLSVLGDNPNFSVDTIDIEDGPLLFPELLSSTSPQHIAKPNP
ncbi:MAG: response regulator [Verrucomicrobiota bacterium]|nr:response regulator [Verrucomicrobiota bacterium]